MRDKGLPVLVHQEQALAKAGDALDQVRPHAARDLASAIERNPRLARDAAEGNMGGAAKAMETEPQDRLDPEKRAGRFVEQWQGMQEARASMERAWKALMCIRPKINWPGLVGRSSAKPSRPSRAALKSNGSMVRPPGNAP